MARNLDVCSDKLGRGDLEHIYVFCGVIDIRVGVCVSGVCHFVKQWSGPKTVVRVRGAEGSDHGRIAAGNGEDDGGRSDDSDDSERGSGAGETAARRCQELEGKERLRTK